MKSTVNLRSNLQVIENGSSPLKDRKFLESLTDPNAIYELAQVRLLADGYVLTQLQENIYRQVSQPCAYALEGDFPWGISIEDGHNKLKCKCINTKCEMFDDCRPDFDEKELEDFIQRSKTWKSRKSSSIYLQKNKSLESKENSEKPKVVVHRKEIEKIEEVNNIDISFEQKDESSTVVKPELEKISVTQIVPEAIKDNDVVNEIQESVSVIKKKIVKVVRRVKPVEQIESNEDKTETPVLHPIETEIKSNEKSFTSFVEVSQEYIIEQSPLSRCVINAGPGTGKTYTLIEKIKYMIREQNIDPSYILILCFSRAAVHVIKERIAKTFGDSDENFALQNIDVRTFDSFSTYLYYQAAQSGNFPLDIKSFEASDYEERIVKAKEFIKYNPEVLCYSHVFIDEVQDLVGVRAEYVTEIIRALNPNTCGFTLLGDSCQAIYDYNAKNQTGFISSHMFYLNLFSEFKDCNFLKLTKNYRQDGEEELKELAEPLRQSILKLDIQKNTIVKVRESLSNCFSDNRQIKKANLNDFDNKKNYGILTRTNGQALQIACWFRNKKINYQLFKRTDGKMNIDAWIYWIFSQYEHSTISSDEFLSLFNEVYEGLEENEGLNCWNSLVGNLPQDTSYPISKILDNILVNSSKNAEYLTKSLLEEPSNIVISNIHQAKGKEFDIVILQKDLFTNMEEEFKEEMPQGILDEVKVLYVGITRPRKELYLVPEDDKEDRFISIFYDGRCYKTRCANGGRGSNLLNYEIGFAEDMDPRSFAAVEGLQDYIINKVNPGDDIVLIKEFLDSKRIRYAIHHIDEYGKVLGYTSPAFWEKMKQVYRRMWKKYGDIDPKYAPAEIVDLQVDRFTTCISKDRIGINDYMEVGDHFMWLGIDIFGFGKSVACRY